MAADGKIDRWAAQLGMVRTRIFAGEDHPSGEHALMLNGARGSFGMSIPDDELRFDEAASWAWSADVACHVHIYQAHVVVSRWDEVRPTQYSLNRVSDQLEAFYERVIEREPKYLVSVARLIGDTLRRIRSAEETGETDRALAALLYLLANWRVRSTSESSSFPAFDRLYQIEALRDRSVQRLANTFENHFRNVVDRPRFGSSIDLKTWPSLVLRHATPIVFQQVHMEMEARGEVDLFGAKPASLGERRGTGVHFTPPGIARSVVEQAIEDIDIHTQWPTSITVLDPACGSGAFLIEVMRKFSDAGYSGRLRIVGYDISESAVLLARFALSVVAQEWPLGSNKVEVSITRRDALSEATWEPADLIVMNPPFIPLVELDDSMRKSAASWLGKFAVGRPDLSMAFVERATQSIRANGTVGSLLPSSVLRLKSADPWRRSISERLAVRSLASLGEFTLFRDATVDTAFVVLRRGEQQLDSSRLTRLLWCGETQGASSSGLRALRKFGDAGRADDDYGRWSIRTIAQTTLARQMDWQPWPGRAVDLLEKVTKSVRSRVGDTFDVKQGALPAPREAFILSTEQMKDLPREEQQWFRPVLENENIRDGQIGSIENYVFYPNSEW
ncbi:MAG: N-6 DNA methylase, partial [Alphaproteobacteria bacterium]|nr:N-6 DNA methylase [Alphaproteobacteria bacterium]